MPTEPTPARAFVLPVASMDDVPFEEYVAAAARAGFDTVTLWANHYERARGAEGLTDDRMRGLLADHGLRVGSIEAMGDWGPESLAHHVAIADALGAPLIAGAFREGDTLPDATRERITAAADAMGARGGGCAVEFLGWGPLRDVVSAWHLVESTGRDNAGIVFDTWHHRRGGGDDAGIDVVPAERIVEIQLADGPRTGRGDADEARLERLLPGDGELRVAELLARLLAHGVRWSAGVEVRNPNVRLADPYANAEMMMDALRRTLPPAGQTADIA